MNRIQSSGKEAAPSDIVQRDLEYILGSLKEEFASLQGKNLLVTGGGGFLGYYLVQSVVFWNRNHDRSRHIQLTVCDNFIRGVPAWLLNLAGKNGLKLMEHDIARPWPHKDDTYHYMVHAASIASPTYYRIHPIETMDANVNGLRNLLDKVVSDGAPLEGFLFFSSSEVYGDPDQKQIPTAETYNGNVSFTGPRACYDESKRYGETLCVNFACQYDLPIRIARPFNNYGPGLKITDRRVIPDFASDILAGNDIVMLSDGSPRRTFCYVADAVVGYFKVLVNGRSGEAYNIGVETPEISMKELGEMMVDIARDLFSYRGKLIQKISKDREYLIDNPNRRCPVIEKARREIGYSPGIPLHEGLRRSLIWYAGNREAEEG